MAQRLISLEEAADQLGISKDRLNAASRSEQSSGLRDGASWKFRSEDIEKLAAEGIPDDRIRRPAILRSISTTKTTTSNSPPIHLGQSKLRLTSDADLGLADEDCRPN